LDTTTQNLAVLDKDDEIVIVVLEDIKVLRWISVDEQYVSPGFLTEAH